MSSILEFGINKCHDSLADDKSETLLGHFILTLDKIVSITTDGASLIKSRHGIYCQSLIVFTNGIIQLRMTKINYSKVTM